MMATSGLAAGSLFANGVRAFVAAVDRNAGAPAAFDAASMGRFDLNAPPMGWLDAGVVVDVKRSAENGIVPIWSGAPATVKSQARGKIGETVTVTFPGWTRVAVALSAGTQTVNLLRTNGAGGVIAEAVSGGSSATVLQLAAATSVQAGDIVVVEPDYTGATGYVGSGIAGAYVSTAPSSNDQHLARRVSFNVARVLRVLNGVVTLASALPAGAPAAGAKVSVVQGFRDRNGGAFLQEWSALFVVDGVQGDRLLLHYPRLQPAGEGAAETQAVLAAGVSRWRPVACLRALPVTDAMDGEQAVCFRTYLPAPMRTV